MKARRQDGPQVELASDVLSRLDRQASELDWAGDHDKADRIRKEAARIRERGDHYLPNF